jgi:hypothetical protein
LIELNDAMHRLLLPLIELNDVMYRLPSWKAMPLGRFSIPCPQKTVGAADGAPNEYAMREPE